MPSPGNPVPLSECTYRRPTESYADSEFLSSLTVPSKLGYVTRWNPSGRPASNPDPMGFDRAGPATMR
jgi:hypothetical protein